MPGERGAQHHQDVLPVLIHALIHSKGDRMKEKNNQQNRQYKEDISIQISGAGRERDTLLGTPHIPALAQGRSQAAAAPEPGEAIH